jgi:GGDEF domain-containing protein
VDGRRVPLSFSIGIAEDPPAAQFNLALKLADVALYAAKTQGRYRACVSGETRFGSRAAA